MDTKSDLAITVLVFNFRRVQGTTLAKAEDESGRIFARAGVHVTWRDCPTGNEPCQKGQGRVFFLAIKAGPVQNEYLGTVSGYALLPHHLAVVHYDYLPRMPRGNGGINETAMVLGCVITHELGHLLLGEREHSIAGILPHTVRERYYFYARPGQSFNQVVDISSQIGVKIDAMVACRSQGNGNAGALLRARLAQDGRRLRLVHRPQPG